MSESILHSTYKRFRTRDRIFWTLLKTWKYRIFSDNTAETPRRNFFCSTMKRPNYHK